MKKKVNPILIIICILVVVLALIIYMYVSDSSSTTTYSQNLSESTSNSNNVTEVTSSIQTIENTLSSSGQISSALDEKIYLYASKYFQAFLVEENSYIPEGTNIIEYTDGTYLTAPYDLVIISKELPNTEEICKSTHYIEVQSINTLCMNLNINESDITKVEIGDVVDITITATEEKFQGNITSISEIGTYNSSGSTFPAVVTFENNGNLKIGMSATCEIIIEKAENVVAVPVEAIQTSDEGKYVVVVNDDGSTKNVTVETGISNSAYTEIKSGISENTKVQMETSTNSSSNMMENFKNRERFENGSNGNSGPGGDFSGGGMPTNRGKMQ